MLIWLFRQILEHFLRILPKVIRCSSALLFSFFKDYKEYITREIKHSIRPRLQTKKKIVHNMTNLNIEHRQTYFV